jgi:hypothetical protein
MKVCPDLLTNTEMAIVEHELLARAPNVLPADWSLVETYVNLHRYKAIGGLHVILEMEFQNHHSRRDLWLHLSVSYTNEQKQLSYDDLRLVKDIFIGRKNKAILVLPSDDEHFNLRNNCLHLFSPTKRDPLPDFRLPDGTL